jgi:hypothetical protein
MGQINSDSLTKLISGNISEDLQQVFFILQKLRRICPDQIQECFKLYDCFW